MLDQYLDDPGIQQAELEVMRLLSLDEAEPDRVRFVMTAFSMARQYRPLMSTVKVLRKRLEARDA